MTFSTVCPQHSPSCAPDDEPARPKEQQNDGIAHSQDEEGEFIKQLLAQHLHRLGVPDVSGHLGGAYGAVKGSKASDPGGVEQVARGMDEACKGDCCEEVSSPVEEDGEGREDGVAVEGEGRAKPEELGVGDLLGVLEVLGLDMHDCGI